MSDCMSRSRNDLYSILDLIPSPNRELVSFHVEEITEIAHSNGSIWTIRVANLIGLDQELAFFKEAVVSAMVEVQVSVSDHRHTQGVQSNSLERVRQLRFLSSDDIVKLVILWRK